MTTLRQPADALPHTPSSSGSAFISNGPWYGVFGSLIFAGLSSALILSFSSRLAAQHSKQGQQTQAAATYTLQQSRPVAHPHPTLLSESEHAHPSPPRGRWLPRHLCSCLTPFASFWRAAAALVLNACSACPRLSISRWCRRDSGVWRVQLCSEHRSVAAADYRVQGLPVCTRTAATGDVWPAQAITVEPGSA